MYAANLMDSDRDLLCKALRFLMGSDGVLATEEWQFLDASARVLGLDPALYREAEVKSALLSQMRLISGEAAKRILLMELVNMAHADGEYNDQERNAVLEMATFMGISSDILGHVEHWVESGIQHATEGQHLFLIGG